MNPEPTQPQENTEKQEYNTPVLVEYGDIHELTQGAGGAFTDTDLTSFTPA